MSIIIGIDHGYYAIKTAHCSFPAGLTSYGEHEPYTRQGLLEFGGCFFVCGTGRLPIQRDKTINDNYYDWEHGCGGSVPIDTILLFDNFEEVEKLLKEWYSQKERLKTRKITGAEYLEWMLKWPFSERKQ